MEQGPLMIAASAILINALILYLVIQSASKSQKRLNMQIAIFYMLAKIAAKQGVEESEIEELTDWMKKI